MWRWEEVEEEGQAAPSDSTADLCEMKSIGSLKYFLEYLFTTFAFDILFFFFFLISSKLNAVKVLLSEISLNPVKVSSPEFKK